MPLSPADVAALSDLLDEVDGITGAGREAWLNALPPERRHLADPLRDMLARPATACLPALPRVPLPEDLAVRSGERAGPYRLLRELGRGGMGVVWLAERADGQFERLVALKLPHIGWGETLARRMQRERHIGARLEHPNIARLYDAGVDELGRPFMALAYVDGQPVDRWCQIHSPDIGRRLSMFIQVLRAVAYAHRQGVIHCDIKPGNILVDPEGQVHLLDFGIAKLLADTAPGAGMTQDIGPALTPGYASPEQRAGGSVGITSDIYSLGVTLHELLTGQRPGADPPPASRTTPDPALRRALRGNIDAILAKALRAESDQRYASADDMADDIASHLAGEGIRARPEGRWRRCGRLLRRYRGALALAATLGTVSVAGLAVAWGQSRRATEDAQRARVVTAFVADLLRLGNVRSAGAASGASAAGAELPGPVARLIEAHFGGDLRTQADLYGAVALAYADVGAGTLAVDFADRQLQALDTLGAAPAERAKAMMTLALANAERGRFAVAESHARSAAGLADPGTPLGLEARALLAGLLMPNGHVAEARALLDPLLAQRPADGGPPSMALARLLDAQGRRLENDNRFDEAVAVWRQAIATAEACGAAGRGLAQRIRLRLSSELLGRNRLAEAREHFEAARTALDAAGDAGRVQSALAASRFAMLAFWVGLMDHAEARSLLESSRQTVAEWGPALPAHVLALVDVRRGAVALRRGDLQAARRLLDPALPLVEAASDGLIDRRGLATYAAELSMAEGDHPKAAGLWLKRLRLRVQSGNGHAPAAAYDWVYLSHNALMGGDPDAAEQVLQQAPSFGALSGDGRAGGAAYTKLVDEQRARIQLVRGDARAALASLPAEYGLPATEDRSDTTLAAYALRGEVLCAAGRPAEGLPYLEASEMAVAPVVGPQAPGLARVRAVAGLCALTLGRRSAARAWAEQARAAFSAQPTVSGWYRSPLVRLDAALAGRSEGRVGR